MSHPQDLPIDPSNWVEEHGDVLFQYAAVRVRVTEIAEDLVQETFLAAIGALDQFRGQSAVRTWLISILRRKIADYFRTQAKEEDAQQEVISLKGHRDYRLQPWSDDPAKLFEQKDFWKVFHECLEKLPEQLSEAYFLREICELPTDEICEVMGITSANLAVRIYRSRALLRHCLDCNWFRGERTMSEKE
ncbi:MAG: sigma-70 family RNA polymerase sigma factor [Gemmataceae bacterium]